MNTYKTLIFIQFLIVNITFGQAHWDIRTYDGIPELDKHAVLEEHFNENPKDWTTNDRQKTKVTFNKGTIYLASTNNNRGVLWKNLRLKKNTDFEIEANIRFVRGKRESFSYIFWDANKESRMGFGISRINHYKGIIYKDYRYTNFIKERKYEFMESGDFNQITVRKVDRKLYCFINGELVATRSYRPPFGKSFGITVPPKSTIEIDYLRVRELKEASITTDNNEPIHEKSMADEDY